MLAGYMGGEQSSDYGVILQPKVAATDTQARTFIKNGQITLLWLSWPKSKSSSAHLESCHEYMVAILNWQSPLLSLP